MRKFAWAGGLIAAPLVLALGAWLTLRAPDLSAETLKAKYGRTSSQYVDLGGGLVVHTLQTGNPAGRPVLLLHGFGDNAFSWDGWADALGGKGQDAKGQDGAYRVIAVDLPGHGLTAAPAGFVASPDSFVDVVERLATKLDLGSVAVAGNSMGGAIAWNWAAQHPQRIGALILVDAAGWPSEQLQKPPLAFRLMQYKLGRDLLASIDNKPLIREGLKKDVVDQSVLTEAFIDRWADLQRFPGHRPILMSARPGSVAASKEALEAIKVPTLILWGEDDQLIAVGAAHKFHAAIPGSKLVIYPKVGHLPQWEIPAKSAADALAFLDAHR
ncbi:alpha/beta fold hydrolase [Novosphingobium sp. FKTRR1]|uniref:alpha/beta fold hydrolase n=1 Tax=Novosphingobium sp. FKTRR1 TaxID=2879118 RepID=UPI001CF03098|nr:alpha/beta hydrolase [Novosphingobium sp. FKTRR1]